jgi:hypothetical protein
MSMPLKKPEGISWNAASVELPEIPTIQPGQDALSATIAAVLPTLAAELTANVATLSAKENMFSGKLGAAQAAYQNSDDSGSQSVGQVVGMLGQMGQQAGQMAQSAGSPMQALGGQTGMFGSLMQQAMQGGQGGGAGAQSGGSAAGGGGGALGGLSGAVGIGGQAQPSEDPAPAPAASQELPAEHDDRETPRHEQREPLHRAETDDRSAAGPSERQHNAGPAPATPSHPRDTDLGRRL